MRDKHLAERKLAVMQLKQGKTVVQVAQSLNRHPNWVRKWQQRFAQEGWTGLRERSRRPKAGGRKLSADVRLAVCQTRLELEAAAALGEGLKYTGGLAVRTKLKEQALSPLPSVSSIERILREACLTKPRTASCVEAISYPHLCPTEPHQLCQVDIVPHFLSGGQRLACFNAIDVVSRYPTGWAAQARRAEDAVQFLIWVWQDIGLAHYTQVDNEGCFSGGATHPYVLGQVVRLALAVGTELVFSPIYHPQSNGFIERFHQDYDRHVWQHTYLPDLAAVNKRAAQFFALYRLRQDHSQLAGQSPHQRHERLAPQRLAGDFSLPLGRQPLRTGRVHFIRRVSPQGLVRVLNVDWSVPAFEPSQGVWVTLELQGASATLAIFDAAPDEADRHCLAAYPFPLKEPVLPFVSRHQGAALSDGLRKPLAVPSLPSTHHLPSRPTTSSQLPLSPARRLGQRLFLASIQRTSRFTQRLFHTMF